MAEMVGTPSVIKLLNKDVIEGIIRAKGPITKPDIAKQTDLSVVTVNKIVALLLKEDRIKASGNYASTGGRRAQFFQINDESYYYVGLYYYKNRYIGAISNAIGKLIYEQQFSVRADSYDSVMTDTYMALDQLIKECQDHPIQAIGLGVPGVVNKGVVTNIPNIPSWEGIDLAADLEKRYKVPVFLENDINLTTLGVYTSYYQKEKVSNMALIYLEQGIGCGFMINRTLYKGFSNFAGELGHIPVRNYFPAEGRSTRYRGDFEMQISLINEALEASEGDERELYREMLVKTIADGLLSVICVLNPEIAMIKHSGLTNSDCRRIEKRLAKSINKSNLPLIVNVSDLNQCSICGVIQLCMKESTHTYSLSNKKNS